jgi:formate/nitrite transporter
MMHSPAEVAKNYIGIGKGKANMPAGRMFVLSIFAGMFIAFAAAGSATAAATAENACIAKLISGCIFPAGLAMVLVAGSELFTGNCLLTIPLLEREITWAQMLRNWLIVYLGNFVGSLFISWAVNASHQLSLFNNGLAGTTIRTAVMKTSLSFPDALIKGILCNVLVCIAVWMAFAAKDVAGKIIGLFFPIMLFVTSGFEHSVANMFYISAGLFAKSNPDYLAAAATDVSGLTWSSFFIGNLVPVTLGNIIGGAVIVGAGYWLAYLKKSK